MCEPFQKTNVLEEAIVLKNLNQVYSHQHSMIQKYDPESELLFPKSPMGHVLTPYVSFSFTEISQAGKLKRQLSTRYSTLIYKFLCSIVEKTNKGEL